MAEKTKKCYELADIDPALECDAQDNMGGIVETIIFITMTSLHGPTCLLQRRLLWILNKQVL